MFAACMALCAQANADRLVYLVGLRHVYSIPVYPDPHELDRQAIEEDYSHAVADGQKQYDTDMASIHDEEAKDNGNVHQIDRDAVQQNLEAAIGDAADRREADLANLYPRVDYIRESHPEFRVDQDGPYHGIEVETAPTGAYENVVYYQPYPDYVWVCPFGWRWGHPYAYATFGVQIELFHSTWISIGSPCFEPVCYGGSVIIVNAPIRQEVIYSRERWVGGLPPRINDTDRSVLARRALLQQKSNYYAGLREKVAARTVTPIRGNSVGNGVPGSSTRLNNRVVPGSTGNAVSRYRHSSTTGGTSPTGNTGSSSATRTGRSVGVDTSSSGASRYRRPDGSSSTSGASRYRRTDSSSSGVTGTSATGGSRYSRTDSSSSGVTGASSTGGSRYGRTSSSGTTGSSSSSRYGRPSGSSTSGYSSSPSSGTTGSSPSRYSHSTSGSGTTGGGSSGSGSSKPATTTPPKTHTSSDKSKGG